MKQRHTGRYFTVTILVTLGIGLAARPASAQFGGQERAEAARRMVILGVQQGISSLPPTSGQSLTYEFDPELSTFVASEQLGPTSFRSTQTIGAGKWSLRGSFTYFRLHKDLGPIKYLVEFPDDPSVIGVTEFGLKAKAKVMLLNLGVNYGITDRLEVNFNVPISVVEARARQVSTTAYGLRDVPASEAVAGGLFVDAGTPIDVLSDAFDDALDGRNGSCTDPANCLALRGDDLDDLGFEFNDDASPGVGRISIGAKYLFLSLQYFRAAFSTEFFNPSPNEVEYAGSESPAILPRFIFEVPAHEYFRVHADAGYDYDFDEAELRRFVWDIGGSVPFGRFTFDAGVGGSIFDVPIRWTPKTATGAAGNGFPATTITAIGDNELGDEFVDFLGGIKFRVADRIILSGAVTTPINNQGFRSDAVGTIAIEGYY